MKKNTKIILFYIIMIAAVLVITSVMFNSVDTEETVYSDIIELFKKEQVTKFTIDTDNKITVTTKEGKLYSYTLRDVDLLMDQVGAKINKQF